jgi:hypothetical protein
VQSKLSQAYPRGAFAVFLDQEAAVLERKCIQVAFYNRREDLLFFRVIFRTTIHETVFLSGVAMKVTVQHKLSLFFHPLYHLLRMKNCWMKLFVRIDPLPIEIHHAKVAAIIADYYSIWIQHRDYFEDKIFSKYLGDICITQEKLNNILDDKGSHGFARVYS